MKGLFFSLLLLFSHGVLGYNYPEVNISFLKKPPAFVFFNEAVRIPVQIKYKNLGIYLYWTILDGVRLERVSGLCPGVPYTAEWLGTGTCHMNLVISGKQLARTFAGTLLLRVVGDSKGYKWDYRFPSPFYVIKVIPHCPSMLNVPIQHATANQEFILNLKSYIKYYAENSKGNTPVEPVVTPAALDGLRYDPKQQAIVGKPTRLGVYNFTVGAKNSRCSAQSVSVTIEVSANIRDKPVFKINPSMSASIPKQKYTMNLLELLQPKAGFMVNNQVKFRIQENMNNAPWLHISATNATKLEGVPPESSAGKTEHVTLIASTNTGGDSAPLTVSIPVAFDPSKQPKVTLFALERSVGAALNFDITPYVDNPTNEPFELFIDKVEPLAPWLSHSKTALKGVIPLDIPGQLYQISFHVSTSAGGSSKVVTILLQVDIDKEKTPYFNNSMTFPTAITGESYFYDFQVNHDISPYDIPYQVELAPDYPTPGWIEIQNNQLIVKEVPNIRDPRVAIYIVLKNIPGGQSNVKKLYLKLLNRNVVEE